MSPYSPLSIYVLHSTVEKKHNLQTISFLKSAYYMSIAKMWICLHFLSIHIILPV